METKIIRDGYDKIAKVYLDNRGNLKTGKYIQQLLKYLQKQSNILDLGCGAGVMVDDVLLKAGHSVIGIDISSEQIRLARKYCRGGSYIVQDISDLVVNEYKVQAIVSFYTLFHLPRVEHLKILKIMNSFLPKKGMLLITMGDREFEGEHSVYGTNMWSSQYGTVRNHQLVEKAGFKILVDEIDNSGGERHQVILAQKI